MAHVPTRPVDRDKAEQELSVNIKKATSTEETAPKQKHVRSECGSLSLLALRVGGELVAQLLTSINISTRDPHLYQNVSSTLGTTAALPLSGLVCAYSPSCRTRCRLSKRLFSFTRFYKRDIRM